MSIKRSRPGNPTVRKGGAVGPDYPEAHYVNPFNMGIESDYGNEHDKTLYSPNGEMITGAGLPLHDNYAELFEGK